MGSSKESLFNDNVETYEDWPAVSAEFGRFPKPSLRRDPEDGEVYPQGCVFRGHACHQYRLQPSIERVYSPFNWAEVEHRSLVEFQSKARMHMNPGHVPQTDGAQDKLGWLAVMQHYGAPTRLLDFTYSPYVALYFALRRRPLDAGPFAEVWAIDAAVLQLRAARVSRDATLEIQKWEGHVPKRHRLNF